MGSFWYRILEAAEYLDVECHLPYDWKVMAELTRSVVDEQHLMLIS